MKPRPLLLTPQMLIRQLATWLVAAAPLVASACIARPTGADGEGATHREVLDVSEPLRHVSLTLGSGDLSLVAAEGAALEVVAEIEGSKNHLRHALGDGTLRLSLECMEQPCSARVEATLPAAAELAAKTGSGDIQLRGARAATELESGSGSITAADIASPELGASSGSGDIELEAAAPLQKLRVRTGSGDVRLRVPAGDYQLRLSTGSGGQRLHGVTSAAAAQRSLEVVTGSGDIRIDGT